MPDEYVWRPKDGPNGDGENTCQECAATLQDGLRCQDCGHDQEGEHVLKHQRAVGECKVIGTHEEAVYLNELRESYREDPDPEILAEVYEDHGITADGWLASL